MVYLTALLLRAIVPGELENTFLASKRIDAVGCVLVDIVVSRVAKEVQRESGFFLLTRSQELHPADILIETQTLLGIFHANHCCSMEILVRMDCDSIGVRVVGGSRQNKMIMKYHKVEFGDLFVDCESGRGVNKAVRCKICTRDKSQV